MERRFSTDEIQKIKWHTQGSFADDNVVFYGTTIKDFKASLSVTTNNEYILTYSNNFQIISDTIDMLLVAFRQKS